MNSLTDNSTYDEIYKILIDTNHEKVNIIIQNLNDHIKQDYTSNYDLPLYLDYILHLLTKTYPILTNYHQNIINMLNITKEYIIHPQIYQSLFANILFSVYICELSKKDGLISNKEFIESIQYIYYEIDIIFDIFNKIFIDADIEFKQTDEKLVYNMLSMLNRKELNDILDSINSMDKFDNLEDKLLLLSSLIIQVENSVKQSMNEYFSQADYQYNQIDNKFDFDIYILNNILDVFNKQNIDCLKYHCRFEQYINMHDIDILQFEKKNVLYFWIDYIGFINGKIIDKILKKV